ncbi:oligopeptide transporter protein [Rutstroemia sp. NJR-2017a BBW]|nr:oligopeptide transporter protein [Rutstroemia sp. NJR-2017a BBW]
MKSAVKTSNAAIAEIPASSQQTDKSAEKEEVGVPEPSESHNVPLAVDKIKTTVWVVAVAGAAERFCYYSLAAPLRKSSITLNVEA